MRHTEDGDWAVTARDNANKRVRSRTPKAIQVMFMGDQGIETYRLREAVSRSC